MTVTLFNNGNREQQTLIGTITPFDSKLRFDANKYSTMK